ncbi:hypothetical protein TSAR_005402 [Trichomalopsis sarcophagae]|uniref:Uncharacterized protein n=1 Tax=Trichomalopsis sarcophagae TaxID=543379 RepID=A0A232EXV1_9HYME|nr:hypothetical protein TSAR_005402 [Trichomalopsis sarcophagae]
MPMFWYAYSLSTNQIGRTIPLFQRVPKHSERRGGILVCLCSGMPIAYLLIRCILRIYLKTKINN